MGTAKFVAFVTALESVGPLAARTHHQAQLPYPPIEVGHDLEVDWGLKLKSTVKILGHRKNKAQNIVLLTLGDFLRHSVNPSPEIQSKALRSIGPNRIFGLSFLSSQYSETVTFSQGMG